MSSQAVPDRDHPEDVTLSDAVREAVTAGQLTASDGAAVALLYAYARAIDQADSPEMLAEMGPRLLAGLSALGLTVAGRRATPQNPPKPSQGGALNGLMERAQTRLARASNVVDAAASGPGAGHE